MFGTQTENVTAVFDNSQWGSKKILIVQNYMFFDQNFIHRNVITGQSLERSNSESMTSFILGENNTALFVALAEMNNNSSRRT